MNALPYDEKNVFKKFTASILDGTVLDCECADNSVSTPCL